MYTMLPSITYALCKSHEFAKDTKRLNVSQVVARRQGEARRLIGSRSTKANTPLYPTPLQKQWKKWKATTRKASLYTV